MEREGREKLKADKEQVEQEAEDEGKSEWRGGGNREGKSKWSGREGIERERVSGEG